MQGFLIVIRRTVNHAGYSARAKSRAAIDAAAALRLRRYAATLSVIGVDK
jgi:hypothetical protein